MPYLDIYAVRNCNYSDYEKDWKEVSELLYIAVLCKMYTV